MDSLVDGLSLGNSNYSLIYSRLVLQLKSEHARKGVSNESRALDQ